MERTALNTVQQTVPVQYDKPRKRPNNIYTDPVEGDSDEDTPKCYQVANSATTTTTTAAAAATTPGMSGAESKLGTLKEDEHIYEMEPTPLYEDSDVGGEGATPTAATNGDDGSIYENADFSPLERDQSLIRKHSSPAMMQDTPLRGSAVAQLKKAASTRANSTSSIVANRKGKRHTPDDYEDPDAVLDNMENDDYMDMQVGEGHNMYIDPEDLRRGGSSASSATPTVTSGSFTSSGSSSSTKRTDSTSSVPGPNRKSCRRNF